MVKQVFSKLSMVFSISINRSNRETGLLIAVNYFSISMNRSNGETGLIKAINDFHFQLTEVIVKQVFSKLSMVFPFQ